MQSGLCMHSSYMPDQRYGKGKGLGAIGFCLSVSVCQHILQYLVIKAPITTAADNIFFFYCFFIFQRKQVLTFHVNCLFGR